MVDLQNSNLNKIEEIQALYESLKNDKTLEAFLTIIDREEDSLLGVRDWLRTLFNVNQWYLDFVPGWFLTCEDVIVLQLGRSHSSPEHLFHVINEDLMKEVGNLKQLKYFNLRGVSGIQELTSSIKRPTNLLILDLRDCPNLQKLLWEIGSVKSLTQLDMSECYSMRYTPKGISSLSQLRVLEGFMIRDIITNGQCKFSNLGKLQKLRKLGLYTRKKYFAPEGEETKLFVEFRVFVCWQ
ncbi:hypothetical protein LguiA_036577 [Lonicera macranthoides]